MLIYTRGGKGSVLPISGCGTETENVIQWESLSIKGALYRSEMSTHFLSEAGAVCISGGNEDAEGVSYSASPRQKRNSDMLQSRKKIATA
jgi:hypothetical protein